MNFIEILQNFCLDTPQELSTYPNKKNTYQIYLCRPYDTSILLEEFDVAEDEDLISIYNDIITTSYYYITPTFLSLVKKK